MTSRPLGCGVFSPATCQVTLNMARLLSLAALLLASCDVGDAVSVDVKLADASAPPLAGAGAGAAVPRANWGYDFAEGTLLDYSPALHEGAPPLRVYITVPPTMMVNSGAGAGDAARKTLAAIDAEVHKHTSQFNHVARETCRSRVSRSVSRESAPPRVSISSPSSLESVGLCDRIARGSPPQRENPRFFSSPRGSTPPRRRRARALCAPRARAAAAETGRRGQPGGAAAARLRARADRHAGLRHALPGGAASVTMTKDVEGNTMTRHATIPAPFPR